MKVWLIIGMAGAVGASAQQPEGVTVKLRTYLQVDGRFFPGGAAALGTSAFLLRRARPVVDATRRYFALRLIPDFGQGKVVLFDAYLDFQLLPLATLRAGKTKPPIGLERLQSATDLRFAERGLPTNLVPNRDVGLQVWGDVGGGAISYAAGVFDGVPDLGNGDGDAGNDKDLVARVFVRPLRGVGLGVAASRGSEHGSVSASALPTYLTPGQQPMFRYRDSSVADGRRLRVTPQAYWYAGPIGVLAEYVASTQDMTRATAATRLTSRSWQLAGSWFVTGETAAFTTVTPRRAFDPAAGHWGAVEIVMRYGALDVDDRAFPVFATATTAVTSAKAWGAGVTWHLAPAVRIAVDYEETHFTGGAAVGDRSPEHFLVTRFQQAF
jgi:phosphate-selective porin OprO/OprP